MQKQGEFDYPNLDDYPKLDDLDKQIQSDNQQNGGGYVNLPFDAVQCMHCKQGFDPYTDVQKLHYLYDCCHLFCKKCLIIYINQNFIKKLGQLGCQECSLPLREQDYKTIMGKNKFEKASLEVTKLQFNIIVCEQCQGQFAFVKGKVQDIQNLKDNKGKKLSNEALAHYAEYRFNCNCTKDDQCRLCKTVPYHQGYTCEQFQKLKLSKVCRYCGDAINKNFHQKEAFSDICNDQECVEKMQFACDKILKCGHPCYGVKGEKKCLPCLNEKCETNVEIRKQLKDQKGSDYCNICFVEGLENAPTIQLLSCGHAFHYQCITKKINTKWWTPRIFFICILCPLCKKQIEMPKDTLIYPVLKELKDLYKEVQRKSLMRLKHEDLDKDPRLSKIGDPYYKKPMEFAMATYSYYQCFKCKKPYFGGRKKCENLRAEAQNNAKFKPDELVCADCSDVGINVKSCEKHGKDFIEFKCRYCCSVAQWFCWGSTHFCEPCHARQCKGDYVSKYTKDKLPQCKGKNFCPLKVDHVIGEEFNLGCAICRQKIENEKQHNF